jgi:hypothetical protein
VAAIDVQPDPHDAQRRDLEKVIRNQRAELKRLQRVEKAHWAYVNRVIQERMNDHRDAQIAAMVEAAMREGMRIAMTTPIEQVPEAFRAAIAAVKRGDA